MKSFRFVFWGALLLMLGVIWLLKTLGVADQLFEYEGWWAFFIIVPCAIRLFFPGDKILSMFGIAVGVVLFLGARDVVDTPTALKILAPVAVISIALSLLFRRRRCDGDHCHHH